MQRLPRHLQLCATEGYLQVHLESLCLTNSVNYLAFAAGPSAPSSSPS